MKKEVSGFSRIVALSYVGFGVAWIVFSDSIIQKYAPEINSLVFWQLLKGLIFVFSSGLFLFVFVGIFMSKRVKIEAERITSIEEKLHLQRVSAEFSERLKKIDSELKGKQALLKAFSEQTTDCIYVKDLEGRYLSFNQAAEKVTGKKIEDVLGKDDTFLFPPEEAKTVMAADRSIMDSGKTQTIEECVTTALGKKRVFLSTKGPLFDSLGTVIGLFGVSRDITERKKIEEVAAWQKSLLDNIPYLAWIKDTQGVFLAVNQAFADSCGRSIEYIVGKTDFSVWPRDMAEKYTQDDAKVIAAKSKLILEEEIALPQGKAYFETFKAPVLDAEGRVLGTVGLARDITERKHSDENLKNSEYRFRQLFENSPVGYQSLDDQGRFIDVNNRWLEVMGYSRDEVIGGWFGDFIQAGQREAFSKKFPNFKVSGQVSDVQFEMVRKDGTSFLASFEGRASYNQDGSFKQTHCIFVDVTERVHLEQGRKDSEKKYRSLFENMLNGVAMHKIVVDASGKPIDYIFLEVNPAYERMTGLKKEDIIGKGVTQVIPGIEKESFPWIETFGKVALEGTVCRIEQYFEPLNRWYYLLGFSPEKNYFSAVVEDISERKKAEILIQRRTEELLRSNAELQQFAYIASHDLQEPLRMISSYLQLLEKRYKNQLDKDADDFIDYAVSGAIRLQDMITGLLYYSRVQIQGVPFEKVNCTQSLGHALFNLQVLIKEQQARITYGELPVLTADKAQITQLFQNLVSNSVKFHGKTAPIIQVSAERKGNEWLFSVKDNGIGIDAQYHDRVFQVFQRIHGREFPGSGIGLAICRKIIERHKGKIWFQSVPNEGTTFYFILPVEEEGMKK